MKMNGRTAFPLAVVGCDFRVAPTAGRVKLIMSSEQTRSLFQSLKSIDPECGFMVLETCNRVEWIVSSEQTDWMSGLVNAQMIARWESPGHGIGPLPEPYVLTGNEAVEHIFRVVTGLESLSAGEAQIAGQFQKALRKAQKAKTSSIIINGLGSSAGRVAKAATRIGFRSNVQAGIHVLVAKYIEQFLLNLDLTIETARIAVAGMGQIGRKTAAIIEDFLGIPVVRMNRTISSQHERSWKPLDDLVKIGRESDVVITASGSYDPVVNLESFANPYRKNPLLVMDIGIPRQVEIPQGQVPGTEYRNIDDLVRFHEDSRKSPMIADVEHAIEREVQRYHGFCMARDMVSLLDTIHQYRNEYIQHKIPEYLEREIRNIDSSGLKRMENLMQRLIRDYANDIFHSIHIKLEDYGSQE